MALLPLHSLRHAAATLWLATPHPLIFVQRQLGHRSITTTEEHTRAAMPEMTSH
jgi:integrase